MKSSRKYVHSLSRRLRCHEGERNACAEMTKQGEKCALGNIRKTFMYVGYHGTTHAYIRKIYLYLVQEFHRSCTRSNGGWVKNELGAKASIQTYIVSIVREVWESGLVSVGCGCFLDNVGLSRKLQEWLASGTGTPLQFICDPTSHSHFLHFYSSKAHKHHSNGLLPLQHV